jgi:hypothetical protein
VRRLEGAWFSRLAGFGLPSRGPQRDGNHPCTNNLFMNLWARSAVSTLPVIVIKPGLDRVIVEHWHWRPGAPASSPFIVAFVLSAVGWAPVALVQRYGRRKRIKPGLRGPLGPHELARVCQWTGDFFRALGLHRLRGTIRYPEAA